MRKYIYALAFLLIANTAHATPPTRSFTYTTGETIVASEVTTNEDAIFNYLSTGVDTYADNTIVNADINSAANIQSDKLNLTSIVQGVVITSSGSLTNAGTFAQSGTSTITGNSTFAGTTIADLGSVTTVDINGGSVDAVTLGTNSAVTSAVLTTADINGGTMDGVNIGTTTATGEIIVNDSSDDANGLGDQGTLGQYLKSEGAGTNPVWAVPITQASSADGSGSHSNNAYETEASQAKTITNGNTVFVICTGTASSSSGEITDFGIKLIDGTNTYAEYTGADFTLPSAGTPFTIQGVATGLSGSTTFSLQTKINSASSIDVANVNITILEF